MKIAVYNFGGMVQGEHDVISKSLPNGAGKTTLLNAYVWALTGRALSGFVPVRVGTTDHTEVTLWDSFLRDVSIRRRADIQTGTTVLYVNGEATDQTRFAETLASRGYDLDLIRACADANALTDPALTSEDLRKLLVTTDVMQGDEVAALRKEAEQLRKTRRQAEPYALSNVIIPQRTVPELTESERTVCDIYAKAKNDVSAGRPTTHCKVCGARIATDAANAAKAKYDDAVATEAKYRGEYARIVKQLTEYDAETQAINDAERLIANATKARTDLIKTDARLAEIDREIRETDTNAVMAALPQGVSLSTEATAKSSGNTRSVCTLTVDGVPLKSVNRARRIEIAVRILDAARARKGMQDAPIWIDNAEAITGCQDIENVIRLTVI